MILPAISTRDECVVEEDVRIQTNAFDRSVGKFDRKFGFAKKEISVHGDHGDYLWVFPRQLF